MIHSNDTSNFLICEYKLNWILYRFTVKTLIVMRLGYFKYLVLIFGWSNSSDLVKHMNIVKLYITYSKTVISL